MRSLLEVRTVNLGPVVLILEKTLHTRFLKSLFYFKASWICQAAALCRLSGGGHEEV